MYFDIMSNLCRYLVLLAIVYLQPAHNDHRSAHRSLLKWLPILQRRALRALTTLFSLLHKPTSPSYLTTHFQYLCPAHSKVFRSSNNRLLRCLSHRSGFLKSSFLVQAVFLWNELPLNIRTGTNRLPFRVKVREQLLKLVDSF